MIVEFKKAGIVLAGLFVAYLLDLIIGPFKDILYDITPISIWRLSNDHVYAIVLTISATIFSWIIAVVGGYLLGHLVGLVAIQHTPHKIAQWFSVIVNQGYTIIYIIPLVITLSLTSAILMHHSAKGNIPIWGVLIGALCVSGLALGGYQVFKSISGAVLRAGNQRLYLAQTLYSKDVSPKNLGEISQLRSLTIVKRLADLEIRSFVLSLELAFHLALVGVIILETITPSLYELIFPQATVSPPWAGGVGRLIVTAQANAEFKVIAGMLWTIVAADFFAVLIMNMYCNHRWLRHYGRSR